MTKAQSPYYLLCLHLSMLLKTTIIWLNNFFTSICYDYTNLTVQEFGGVNSNFDFNEKLISRHSILVLDTYFCNLPCGKNSEAMFL